MPGEGGSYRGFDEKEVLLKLRTWKEEVGLILRERVKENFQERKGRQLPVETQERYEGDILVGSSDLTTFGHLEPAVLANRDKLWPSGVVEYKFWRTFPRCFDNSISTTMSMSCS